MNLNDIEPGKLRAEHLRDPRIRQDILKESGYDYASDAASHMICLAFEAIEQAELEAQDNRTFPLKHRGEYTYYRMYHDLELSLNTATGEADYHKDQTYALSADESKPEFVLGQAKAARKHSAKIKYGGPYSKVTQFLDEWIQARTA